jgi:hypothetical protein
MQLLRSLEVRVFVAAHEFSKMLVLENTRRGVLARARSFQMTFKKF